MIAPGLILQHQNRNFPSPIFRPFAIIVGPCQVTKPRLSIPSHPACAANSGSGGGSACPGLNPVQFHRRQSAMLFGWILMVFRAMLMLMVSVMIRYDVPRARWPSKSHYAGSERFVAHIRVISTIYGLFVSTPNMGLNLSVLKIPTLKALGHTSLHGILRRHLSTHGASAAFEAVQDHTRDHIHTRRSLLTLLPLYQHQHRS